MRNLTKKEEAVFSCIRAFCAQNGYAPSVRDIGEAMGYRSTSTVQMYLDRLAACGYIRKADGKSRSILLCEQPQLHCVHLLKKEITPRRDLAADDFDGELEFFYRGALAPDARLIGIVHGEEVWVVLQASKLPSDKPLVAWQGNLPVRIPSEKAEDVETIGALLAVIKIL